MNSLLKQSLILAALVISLSFISAQANTIKAQKHNYHFNQLNHYAYADVHTRVRYGHHRGYYYRNRHYPHYSRAYYGPNYYPYHYGRYYHYPYYRPFYRPYYYSRYYRYRPHKHRYSRSYRWRSASAGRVPRGAIVSKTYRGKPLFRCQAVYANRSRYGYVTANGCRIKHGGKYVTLKNYRVKSR